MKKLFFTMLIVAICSMQPVSAQIRWQIWPGVDMPLPQNPAYIYDAAGPLGVVSPYLFNSPSNSQLVYIQEQQRLAMMQNSYFATGNQVFGFGIPPSTGTIIMSGLGSGLSMAAQVNYQRDQQRQFYQNNNQRRVVYRQQPPPPRIIYPNRW